MNTRNILAASAFLLGAGILPLRAGQNPRSIRVTGEGEIKVTPDQAVFRFGVQTENIKLEEAKNENSRKTKKLLKALQKLGVKQKNIQTARIQINPVYRYDRGKRIFTHYAARKDFTITVNDLDNYGKILNAAVAAGVENVSGIQFQSSRLEDLKAEARKKAARNAKQKAADLAAVFGQKIGEPLSIQENVQFERPVPVIRGMEMAARRAPAPPEDQIAPGEMTVRATLAVEFELK